MVLLTMTSAIVAALENIQAQQAQNFSEKTPPEKAESQPPKTEIAEDNTSSDEGINTPASSQDLPIDGSSLLNPAIGNPINHSQIVDLSYQLRASNITPYHLDILMRGSRIYIPPPPPKPEPTPEYVALMARLRREAESRAYARLTAPSDSASPPTFPTTSPAYAFSATDAYIPSSPDDDITYADVNRQMTLIFNVMISVVACAAALWMVARWWSTPARLALSMGGSTLVGLAEVVVYFGYLRKVKEAGAKEKGKTEIKEVVGTWVIGNDGQDITRNPSDERSASVVIGKNEDDKTRRRKKGS